MGFINQRSHHNGGPQKLESPSAPPRRRAFGVVKKLADLKEAAEAFAECALDRREGFRGDASVGFDGKLHGIYRGIHGGCKNKHREIR